MYEIAEGSKSKTLNCADEAKHDREVKEARENSKEKRMNTLLP
jgi:hypothetical protein